MYENERNADLKKRIISIIKENTEYKDEIFEILLNELKEAKLSTNTAILYCGCGYPVSYYNGEKQVWIEGILKQEVDFRSYREFYYCPNCDRLLEEFQH